MRRGRSSSRLSRDACRSDSAESADGEDVERGRFPSESRSGQVPHGPLDPLDADGT